MHAPLRCIGGRHPPPRTGCRAENSVAWQARRLTPRHQKDGATLRPGQEDRRGGGNEQSPGVEAWPPQPCSAVPVTISLSGSQRTSRAGCHRESWTKQGGPSVPKALPVALANLPWSRLATASGSTRPCAKRRKLAANAGVERCCGQRRLYPGCRRCPLRWGLATQWSWRSGTGLPRLRCLQRPRRKASARAHDRWLAAGQSFIPPVTSTNCRAYAEFASCSLRWQLLHHLLDPCCPPPTRHHAEVFDGAGRTVRRGVWYV